MAIYFKTDNPSALLNAFKKAIEEKRIVTWLYKDGYFTHDTDQWRWKAWLSPVVRSGVLVMNIINPKGSTVTSEVYAIYHGRFIESMLAHFDNQFSEGSASAFPSSDDIIS